MDISYLGLSSLRLRGKKTTLVLDPFKKEATGIVFEGTEADGVALTSKNASYIDLLGVKEYRVVIDGPGEYEVGGIGVMGIAADGITAYYIKIDSIAILVLGLLTKQLTEGELEKYPPVDIVFVPVGGKEAGTLSGQEAADLVSKLEPKLVVPIAFKRKNDSKLTLPLATVDDFLKAVGKEHVTSQSKLSITKEKLPSEMEVVVLE